MSNVLYFSDCESIEDLNAMKEKLYSMFGMQIMKPNQFPRKAVDEEYLNLKMAFEVRDKPEESSPAEQTLDEVLAKIKDWNCDAEICGRWLWLSGRNIYSRFNDLKELGFQYAQNKKSFYWRPECDAKSPNHSPVSMELIREKYGTRKVALAQ